MYQLYLRKFLPTRTTTAVFDTDSGIGTLRTPKRLATTGFLLRVPTSEILFRGRGRLAFPPRWRAAAVGGFRCRRFGVKWTVMARTVTSRALSKPSTRVSVGAEPGGWEDAAPLRRARPSPSRCGKGRPQPPTRAGTSSGRGLQSICSARPALGPGWLRATCTSLCSSPRQKRGRDLKRPQLPTPPANCFYFAPLFSRLISQILHVACFSLSL